MRFANVDGRGCLVVGNRVHDVADASGGALPGDPMALLDRHWDDVLELAASPSTGGGGDGGDGGDGDGEPLAPTTRLRSPVPAPRAILGLVANYPPATRPEPPLPMVFGKLPTAVCGPFDDIRLPHGDRLPMGAEWTVLEAELAIVIGPGGRVAGLTVAQDITERVHELGPRGTSVGSMDYESLKTLGKSLDTFCPLGPVLVTTDELDDPDDLAIECRLNGEVVQRASTAELLFSATELLATLSALVTLRPGDVILTGTPTPLSGQLPRLRPGDVIETEIAGIGCLRNVCVRDDLME